MLSGKQYSFPVTWICSENQIEKFHSLWAALGLCLKKKKATGSQSLNRASNWVPSHLKVKWKLGNCPNALSNQLMLLEAP